jgi:hypothetical protein
MAERRRSPDQFGRLANSAHQLSTTVIGTLGRSSRSNAVTALEFIYETMRQRADIWRLRPGKGQVARLGPMGLLVTN